MRGETESKVGRTSRRGATSMLSRTSVLTGTRTRAATVTQFTVNRASVLAEGIFWGRHLYRLTRAVSVTVFEWFSETVSAAGLFLCLALIGGVVTGLSFGLAEAWVGAAIAATLLSLSIPFLFGGRDYDVTLDLDRNRVVAGSDVVGQLSIINRSRRVALPGVVDITVGEGIVEAHVPLLRAAGEHRQDLTIAARRRGVINVGPLLITRGDPLGILRRETSWSEVQRVFVHPQTVAIPSTSAGLIRDLEGLPTTDIVDSDLSFHAIREYAAGDSQRNIHWRSTARTGKLMVRQYEESRRSRIALLLGLNQPQEYQSDDEFEMAVSAVASLGAQGIRDNRDVLLTTSAEIPEVRRAHVQSILSVSTVSAKAMFDGLSEVEMNERAMSIEDIAALTIRSFPEISIAFIVAGSMLPLARLRVAAFAFPPKIRVVAVRCEPGAEPSVRMTSELTVITIGALHDLKHLMSRGAVL
jgi:uncharacterized protein (DUF58 family)